jgi:hypothetical protein
MNYAQFKDRVSEILQDKAEKLSATERDNFIQEAVKIYSKHRPREVIRDISGDGLTYDFAIATNLTSWVKGFSTIKSVEYPADERTPSYIEEEEDYRIIEKETGQFLRIITYTPSATQKVRVLYTALHILRDAVVAISVASPAVISWASHGLKAGDTVRFQTTGALPTGISVDTTYYVISAGLTANAFEISATRGGTAINTSGTQSGTHRAEESTIPASDEDALCDLGASLCSGALASIYAHVSDSTISADSVDHRSKAQEFASRAREQRKNYLNHMGIKEGTGEVAPAAVVKDLDVDYPGGSDRLTHPRKTR